MNIYIAGESEYSFFSKSKYVLKSFFYQKKQQQQSEYHYMLDSGAFTFFSRGIKNINLEKYVEDYIYFIKKNNVELFLELDIDSIVGYDRVLEIRKKIEKEAGRQCIPVWHKSRGVEDFKKMCKEYKYVAIGGIASGEIKKKEYGIFSYLLSEAKKTNTKVHGLGFTSTSLLHKYRFYSVDSTAWLGDRFGIIFEFQNGCLITHTKTRLKNWRISRNHNLNEWLKFQKYAELNL